MEDESLLHSDLQRLEALARVLAPNYRSARPFAHVCIDDFLPEPWARQLRREFPGPDEIEWTSSYADTAQLKLACEDDSQFGPATRRLIAHLHSSGFLRVLEQLTGIAGLIPDPHLKGGGLHQIRPGGFLKVHADFNWYERLALHRRLNLLIYLNDKWDESYGGHLELWNTDMASVARRILPVFNRCVVFSTTDMSFHGHPEPLRCPAAETRKSLALYYYTTSRPVAERSEPHTTLFQERPAGDDANRALIKRELRRARGRRLIRRLTPPIVIEGWRALTGNLRTRRR